MSVPVVLETIPVGTKDGPRCQCWRAPRKAPIDVYVAALPMFRAAFQSSTMQPDSPVLVWRCRECRGLVTITARDLHLAA